MREVMVAYLPWALSAFTVAVMVLAGNKHRWTWIVGLIAQAFWVTWIIASESWGLFPSALVLIAVYARNHMKWEASARTGAPGTSVAERNRSPQMNGSNQ